MNRFYNDLRNDIQKRVSFKIVSTTEAKALLEILEAHGIFSISLSTLRRFFGLIPSRKPNLSTLNEFSSFLGFQSFGEYIKSKNLFEEWYQESHIQRIKYSEKLTDNDVTILNNLYTNEHFAVIFSNMIEYKIANRNYNFLKTLFESNQLLLFKDSDYQNNQVYKISELLYNYILHLSDKDFIVLIEKLIHYTRFRDYIIYNYVDVINLNNRYGVILETIIKQHIRSQEKLFLNCVLNLKKYLNGMRINSVDFNSKMLYKYPQVLIGRYYGYQLLYFSSINNSKQFEIFFEKAIQVAKKVSLVDSFFYEFIQTLLLIKRFDKIKILIENFYEDLFEASIILVHVHHFLYVLSDAIFCYSTNDIKASKLFFDSLNINYLSISPTNKYFRIFYHILGYHLNNNQSEKREHLNNYLEIVQESKYKIYNKKYLEDYFIQI